MRLRNSTDISEALIRQIIRAVRPAGLPGCDVRISNGGGRTIAGRAYASGHGYHETASPFLVVRIPLTDALARQRMSQRGAYLGVWVGSRLEALVFVLAHEFRHIWQKHHTRGKVWGSKGRFSERDADAYGLRMLRAYRRGELAIKW